MAYSHARMRKVFALVRIVTGAVFVSTGAFKVSSLEFSWQVFPDFLHTAALGGAASWLQPVANAMLNAGTGKFALVLGFTELFVGVALLLGLVVRPACLIGILYSLALLAATWNTAEGTSMQANAEHQFRHLFPLMVFLLLGVGHAGETWGIGALYHHHRSRRWAMEPAEPQVALRFAGAAEPSVEEFAEEAEEPESNGEDDDAGIISAVQERGRKRAPSADIIAHEADES